MGTGLIIAIVHIILVAVVIVRTRLIIQALILLTIQVVHPVVQAGLQVHQELVAYILHLQRRQQTTLWEIVLSNLEFMVPMSINWQNYWFPNTI